MFLFYIEAILISFEINQGLLKSVDYDSLHAVSKNAVSRKSRLKTKKKNKQYISKTLQFCYLR